MRLIGAWVVFVQHRERELPMTRLTTELQNDLHALLAGGDPTIIAERVRALPAEQIALLLAVLHPADGADVLEELESDQQRAVFAEIWTHTHIFIQAVEAFLASVNRT